MKKRAIKIFSSFLITVAIYVFIQFIEADNIQPNCLVSDFEEVFQKENGIALNKTYDFSRILKCKSWDKIIIAGGPEVSRTAIFLKEGVAVPEIDYSNRISGCLLIYFIEDGRLTCPPIKFWRADFLYFQDFNDYDFVSLDKQNAVFKCVELETVGFDMELLTFELVKY